MPLFSPRFWAWIGAAAGIAAAARAAPQTAVFDAPVAAREWTLAELNPALPANWDRYNFLVLEFRTTSSQRFELGLDTAHGLISKRIHPFPNVWLRASIPLRFYRQPLGDGRDLAATVNQPRNTYWINIEGGGNGPTDDVRGLRVTMRYPVGRPTLELRSVALAVADPGDAVLDGEPVVDEFGQYNRVEWPGKAHSLADLRAAWADEAAALASAAFPDRSRYGGFAGTYAAATGFFRVAQIGGRWWFVDPDGRLFYSVGVNAIVPFAVTRVAGREGLFAALPDSARVAAFPGAARGGPLFSFYTANVERRYGADWRDAWADLTARRLLAWGLNTASGSFLSDARQHVPYVLSLRDWPAGTSVMGLPDVYAGTFVRQIDAAAVRQLGPHRQDPWLIGYFIGNEPPWPHRESQLVDLILAGPPTAMRARLRTWLADGDTPERRRRFVLEAFARYLAVVDAAVKRADPNHLNLGIRFGGDPPDEVIRLARGFDVYSFNKYRYAVPAAYLDHLYALVGRPILISEFHIGAPERGLAPGLVLARNQAERGVAYRYYAEHAAAHPDVIGTHWFEWIDEPVTGRPDGENYNIGWIDVTDRPYAELVAAAKLTHARLLGLHAGRTPPFDRRPQASDVGTPAEAEALGLPGIQ